MSIDKINHLEKEQEIHAYKIESINKTIDVLFPPLIEQLKEVSSNLAANTLAINNSTLAQEHLTKDVQDLKDSGEKLSKAIDDTNKEITEIKITQSGNQVVINAVKGIGMKIFASTVTIVIAAIGVAAAIIKNS